MKREHRRGINLKWPGKQIPLSAIHSKPLQHIQLFRPFNALCNHQTSYFMREADETSGQCTPFLIRIDRVSKTHIKLDDLGLEIEDVPHAGIACTSIINRQFRASATVRLQPNDKSFVILDRSMFSDLQDQTGEITNAIK